jgi:hypothetical protein
MRIHLLIAASATTLALSVTHTTPLAAQSPVATAFRDNAKSIGKNLIAAAEVMPADKYNYRPTAPQMSFADVIVHLQEGNDLLCGVIGGMKAPTRPKMAATAPKDSLIARLRETFKFCDEALAKLDDSKLSEELTLFGAKKYTRAAVETITTGDWADHYSQLANYLRLNNLLPPTAKK